MYDVLMYPLKPVEWCALAALQWVRKLVTEPDGGEGSQEGECVRMACTSAESASWWEADASEVVSTSGYVALVTETHVRP